MRAQSIAPGERIDDAGRTRLLGKQRPDQRIRLDVDHHDVLSAPERETRQAHAGCRIAGRLDDHVDARIGDDRLGVGRQERTAAFERGVEADGFVPLPFPTGGGEAPARPGDVQIGEGGDVQPPRQARLGQKHGSELACADLGDTHRTAGARPCGEHGGKVHA